MTPEPPAQPAVMLRIENFDKLAAAHGLNDVQLAKHIGVGRTTLWRVRNGEPPSNSFMALTLTAFPAANFDLLFETIDRRAAAARAA